MFRIRGWPQKAIITLCVTTMAMTTNLYAAEFTSPDTSEFIALDEDIFVDEPESESILQMSEQDYAVVDEIPIQITASSSQEDHFYFTVELNGEEVYATENTELLYMPKTVGPHIIKLKTETGEELSKTIEVRANIEIDSSSVILSEPNDSAEVIETISEGTILQYTEKITIDDTVWYKIVDSGYLKSPEQTTQNINSLNYEDNEITVSISGTLPFGTSLSVEKPEEDSDDYKLIEQMLIEKYDASDSLTYNITLKDESGNEIEPDGDVNVAIEYKNTEIESQDIKIIHFEEDDDGNIKDAVAINQLQNISVNNDNLKVEYTTNSFSYYSVVWRNITKKAFKVYYVDGNGKEITVSGVGTGTTYDWQPTGAMILETSPLNKIISGYSYTGAVVGKTFTSAEPLTSIKAEPLNTYYTDVGLEYSNDDKTWKSMYYTSNRKQVYYNVYMVYKKSEKIVNLHYAYYGDNGLTIFPDKPLIEIALVNNVPVELSSNRYCQDKIEGFDLNRIIIKPEIRINDIRLYNGQTEYKCDNEWIPLNFSDVYLIYKQKESYASGGGSTFNPVPEHHKWIKKNQNDYTLALNVKGAVGSIKPMDILIIVDTSGSMKDIDANQKSIYKNVNAAIDVLVSELKDAQVKNPDLNINLSMVTFAKTASIRVPWSSIDTFSPSRYTLNDMDCDGGTNWEHAIRTGESVLSERTSTKYVVFLTDGNPTYYRNGESGTGYETADNIKNCYKPALQAWQSSTTINNSEFQFIVQAGAQANYCKNLYDDVKSGIDKHIELIDGTSKDKLIESFQQMAHDMIAPAYEKVSITDVLSEYVEFPDGFTEEDVSVYRIDPDGIETQMTSNYTIIVNDNMVTCELLNGGRLPKDTTYRIEFNVIPSQKAYDDYKDESYNGIKGDIGTGETSSDKPGFYSNVYDETYVQYTVGDKTDQSAYEKPVIQVDKTETNTINILKIESNHPDIKLEGAEFRLEKWTGEKYETVSTLITDENGKAQFLNLPDGKYRIVEIKAPDGYSIGDNKYEITLENNDIKDLVIENNKLYELPSTGGPGTYIFTITGTIVMALALILIRKKEKIL